MQTENEVTGQRSAALQYFGGCNDQTENLTESFNLSSASMKKTIT